VSALVGRVTTFVALLAVGACGTKVTPPPELGAIDLTCRLPLVDGPKVECALEVREHAGRVLYEDHAMVDRLEGSSSPFVKPSYEMELRDLVGANLSANFFGMGADGDWVLDGFESDRSMMRSALIYDSFRAVGGGRYAPEGRYCTLSLNGVDQGLYRLVEKIKRDDDRVDIAADDGSGTSFVVESSNADDGALPNGLGMKWEFVSPSDASVTHRQRDGLESWLTAIDDTLASATPADVFKHIDRDALADWILIEELAKNLHGFSRGVYFSRDAGRPARLVPWDIDLSFGQPTITDDVAIPPNDSPEGWIPERPDFIHELVAIPELHARLAARWRAFRGGPWSDAAISRRLDDFSVTLDPAAVINNFEIWDAAAHDTAAEDGAAGDGATDADTDADPEAGVDADAGAPAPDAGSPDGDASDAGPPKPTQSFYPVADYADEVAKLRAFITARLAWIDAHVDAY